MLAWRYGKHAPERLAAVAGLLADHAEPVRAAFLAEASKHVDAAGREALAAALARSTR